VFESGTYQGAGLRSMEGVPSVQHRAAVSGTEARVIVSAVQRTNASGEQTLVGTSGRQTLSIPSFQMKDLRMSVVEDAQRQSISQQWEHRASSQQSAPENISLSPMKMDSKLLIGSRRVSVINEAEPSDVLQRTVSIQPHPAAGNVWYHDTGIATETKKRLRSLTSCPSMYPCAGPQCSICPSSLFHSYSCQKKELESIRTVSCAADIHEKIRTNFRIPYGIVKVLGSAVCLPINNGTERFA
jgi:hypothetical protein